MIKLIFRTVLSSLVLTVCLSSFLQAQHRDYVIKDSLSIFQVRLTESTPLDNATKIKGVYFKDSVVFTPDDIEGYGLQNGKEWTVFAVPNENGEKEKFFLRRLYIASSYDLYYLRTRRDISRYYLYLRNGEEIIPIPEDKEEYVPLLQQWMQSCPRSVANAEFSRLKRNSLIRFFKSFNTCYQGSLPRPRIFGGSGYALSKFNPKVPDVIAGNSTYLFAVPEFEYTPTYFASILVDAPIASTNTSFNTGVIISTTSNDISFERSLLGELPSTYTLKTENTWFLVPFNFRYTFFKPSIKPYFQAGFNYARFIKNEAELYRYDLQGNLVTFRDLPEISPSQVGFSWAAGAILKYDSKLSYFAEIKYSELYSRKKSEGKINVNQIFLTVGILY